MSNSAKIIFAGDVWIRENKTKIFSSKIEKLIRAHDLAWVNLEGPIADDKDSAILKAGPNLKQSSEAVKILEGAGFRGFCLANNHIWDYGISAFKKTRKLLANVITTGAGTNLEEAYCGKVVEIKGIKLGFISLAEWGFGAAESGGGFAWINHQTVKKRIRDMKKRVDFLCVQVHAGLEEINIPLPEWRQKYKELIDWGADLIVGHHPHVVQPWEKYKNKHIFYSLGNCYFGKEDEGIMLSVSITRDCLKSFKIWPIKSDENSVSLDKRDVSVLNKEINGSKYYDEINRIVKQMWKERYRPFYEETISRNIWGKTIINETLLRHNLKIESHYWTTLRVLALNSKNV